jgi:hypothetical protein
VGNDFLHLTPKPQGKKRDQKVELHQNLKLYASKDTIKKG